jgi:hypothetical protein
MGQHGSRYIVLHFLWTISIATVLFPIGGALFHLLLLFNAAMTGAMAAFRGDSWRARRLTLWDEAVAFIGICLLTGLWR